MIGSKHRPAFVSQQAGEPAEAERERLQLASSYAVQANFMDLCQERRTWRTRWRSRMLWHAP
jgi:hypothetical protein